MAGRKGEKVGCSALSITQVSPDVFIGGDSAQDPRVAIQPEVPPWAVTALQVLGVAGAIAATPYSIVALGVAGTIATGVLGTAGPARLTTLPPGTTIDRHGPPTGGYTSPAGEPFPARTMRGDPPTTPANVYTVRKGLPVEEADIGPWFDQPGGGKQYRIVDPARVKTRYSVQDGIDDGFLK